MCAIEAGWKMPGEAESLRQARAYLREALGGHLSEDDLYAVLLAACELGTNAIRHSSSGGVGGWYRLEVQADAERVRVAVADEGGPLAPEAEDLGDVIAERGRGLAILATLGRIGWEGDASGRRVWAELPIGGAR